MITRRHSSCVTAGIFVPILKAAIGVFEAGAWVILLHVVLEETPQEEIWRIQVKLVSAHFTSAVQLLSTKPFAEPGHGGISSERLNTILLEPLFIFINVLTLLELSQNCSSAGT